MRGSGKPSEESGTGEKVDIRDWDVIVVNTSGGKDSQAMLSLIADEALDWIEGVRGHYAAACNP